MSILNRKEFGRKMEKAIKDARQDDEVERFDCKDGEPSILEEIDIEEIFVDGICGVY